MQHALLLTLIPRLLCCRFRMYEPSNGRNGLIATAHFVNTERVRLSISAWPARGRGRAKEGVLQIRPNLPSLEFDSGDDAPRRGFRPDIDAKVEMFHGASRPLDEAWRLGNLRVDGTRSTAWAPQDRQFGADAHIPIKTRHIDPPRRVRCWAFRDRALRRLGARHFSRSRGGLG